MEKAEQETIVTINQADRDEGYFTFGTSYRPHWERLVKRMGGQEKLIEVRESKSTTGEITWRQARVPIVYLHPSLAIRTEKSTLPRRVLPQEHHFKRGA